MGATIAVAGATGALGKEIVSVLHDASWKPEAVVPLASAASTVPFVDWGEESVAVDDLATQEFDEVDALILAVPPAVATEAGEKAMAAGIPVIDCSGAFGERPNVPLFLPWVNPQALDDIGPEGVVVIPGPTALLLAGVLGPLRRAGVVADVDATVLVPASAWGRGGIEELSSQVVSLFNQGTPSRKVFKDGFAFDLLPQIGTVDESGWTDEERSAVAHVTRLIGPGGALRVSLVGVPVFNGISATIHLRSPHHLDPALTPRILADGGVGLPKSPAARHLPRPRRDGQPFVQVGRLRSDPVDGGLHVWASLDNLKGAAAAAVAATGALLKRRSYTN